jgi:hypothetical protein
MSQKDMSYWGKDVDERELMKVLQTTSEEGTYPENIVRGRKRWASKLRGATTSRLRRSSSLRPAVLR